MYSSPFILQKKNSQLNGQRIFSKSKVKGRILFLLLQTLSPLLPQLLPNLWQLCVSLFQKKMMHSGALGNKVQSRQPFCNMERARFVWNLCHIIHSRVWWLKCPREHFAKYKHLKFKEIPWVNLCPQLKSTQTSTSTQAYVRRRAHAFPS